MWKYIGQSIPATTKEEEAIDELVPKKAKILPFMEYSCHVPISCFIRIYIYFSLHFSNFSQTDNTFFYNQHNAIYSLQQRNTVDFGLWSWFSSFERKRSRWKPYNQLPGNSVGSLVFVAVPKKRIFGKSPALKSHNSQQQETFEMREEVLSSVRAQVTDTRWYELSDPDDIEFSWEDPAVDMDSVCWLHNYWEVVHSRLD